MLSNAFSAEFGWTAGPALNIVTKSGTNALHGEGLYLGRPGDTQAKTFATEGFCAPSVSTCFTPNDAHGDQPGGRPRRAGPVLGVESAGRSPRTRRSSSRTADYTMQDRTTFLSPTLPTFVLPPDGSLTYVGHYRQRLLNAGSTTSSRRRSR